VWVTASLGLVETLAMEAMWKQEPGTPSASMLTVAMAEPGDCKMKIVSKSQSG